MRIEEIEQEIIEEFEHLRIGSTNKLPHRTWEITAFDWSYVQTENYIITGCQSQVWLHATLERDKVIFKADSDAIITKGIVGLLIRVLSGQSCDDIMNAKLEFVDKIGLPWTPLSYPLQRTYVHDQTNENFMHWLLKPKCRINKSSRQPKTSNQSRPCQKIRFLELEGKIVDVIKTIFDPEIPVSIYELGLIYEINIDEQNVAHITMTLTAPNCPEAEFLPVEVHDKVKEIEGISDVEIILTLISLEWRPDERWGKFELGLL